MSTDKSEQVVTGHPPGMLQDDDRKLSKALANTPGALRHAAGAVAEIERARDAERYRLLRSHPRFVSKIALDLGYGFSHSTTSPMHGGAYLDEILDEVAQSGKDAWGVKIAATPGQEGGS